MAIDRKKYRVMDIDDSHERLILTGMIVSTTFLRDIVDQLDLAYFRSDFSKTLVEWIVEYFEQFGCSPSNEIHAMFESKREVEKLADEKIMAEFLTQLSQTYEQNTNINTDYLLDIAIKYFKKREIWLTANAALHHLEKDNLTDAEAVMLGIKNPSVLTSDWCNPLTSSAVSRAVLKVDNPFYTLPGALGQLIGPVEPGWVLGVLAPPKRYKTFNVLDWAVDMMVHGKRTAFVTFEMTEHDTNNRIYKILSAYGNEDRMYRYPVFDCMLNQTGECEAAQRKNKIALVEKANDPLPEFDPADRYEPCTACRYSNPENFVLTTWWTEHHRPAMHFTNTWGHVKGFAKTYGDNIRVKSYPKFSASISQVINDLHILREKEGFIYDSVIIDYPGIAAPENTRDSPRDQMDGKWKRIGQLASEDRCFVVAPAQGNRGSITKASMEQADTAEDIRIVAHVDIMAVLNQTAAERRAGINRVGVIAHRHREMDETVQALCLQQSELGQMLLDSELIRMASNEGGRYSLVRRRREG